MALYIGNFLPLYSEPLLFSVTSSTKYGINEDPVTGSAHTTLIPYWSEKLNKISLTAKQVSKRGGELFCENTDNRVLIGGNAVLYMKGVIEID